MAYAKEHPSFDAGTRDRMTRRTDQQRPTMPPRQPFRSNPNTISPVPSKPTQKDEEQRIKEKVRLNNVNRGSPVSYRISAAWYWFMIVSAFLTTVLVIAAFVVSISALVMIYHHHDDVHLNGRPGEWDASAPTGDGGGEGELAYMDQAGLFYTTSVMMSKLESATGSWVQPNRDSRSSRRMVDPKAVSSRTASGLKLAWERPFRGEILGQPSVHSGVAYVCDASGYLSAVRTSTGDLLWEVSVMDIVTNGKEGEEDNGASPDVSCRGTPALVPGAGLLVASVRGTNVLFVVYMMNGSSMATTHAGFDSDSIIEQDVAVVDGRVYVGLSASMPLEEEGGTGSAFRGSVASFDLATMALLWVSYNVPQGFTGAGVSSRSPITVDHLRGQIYVTTNGLNDEPTSLVTCRDSLATMGMVYYDNDPCLPRNVRAVSVTALDASSGRVRWNRRIMPYSAWDAACGITTPVRIVPNTVSACVPDRDSMNADFAQSPILMTVGKAPYGRDVLVVGQASGVMYFIDPRTGEIEDSTTLGPEGARGGIWESGSHDGSRVFMINANTDSRPYFPVNPVPGSLPVSFNGSLSGAVITAVKAVDGYIEWQYPMEPWLQGGRLPITVVNDVVFVPATIRWNLENAEDDLAPLGVLRAHSASTGTVLWESPSLHEPTTGVTAAAGMLFIGTRGMTRGEGPYTLLAFSV